MAPPPPPLPPGVRGEGYRGNRRTMVTLVIVVTFIFPDFEVYLVEPHLVPGCAEVMTDLIDVQFEYCFTNRHLSIDLLCKKYLEST